MWYYKQFYHLISKKPRTVLLFDWTTLLSPKTPSATCSCIRFPVLFSEWSPSQPTCLHLGSFFCFDWYRGLNLGLNEHLSSVNFLDKISLSCPGCPWTCDVSASASGVAEDYIQACDMMPGLAGLNMMNNIWFCGTNTFFLKHKSTPFFFLTRNVRDFDCWMFLILFVVVWCQIQP